MLDGVRVLDLSRLLPGPACTAWLVGQGALVDRVEPPGRGDFARHVPPFVDGHGAWFAATSAGKRSLALDLRHPEAGPLLRRLLGAYDVLVEGFRPGVLEAMGLAPDDLLATHPRLVVARLSGFGQTGPWRRRPGHDVNYLGLSGAFPAGMPDPSGAPALAPVLAADHAGALVAAAGIAAALFDRERSGRGRVLDVSLTEAAVWTNHPLLVGSVDGDPGPAGGPFTGAMPLYGVYRCADGRHLTLGALEPSFQQQVFAALGPVGTREDVAVALAREPRDVWVERLAEACAAPALAPSEVADHPQLRDRDAVRRVADATWVRPPLGRWPEGPPPGLGEHTDAVLADGGIGREARQDLRERGVVA